MIGPDWHACLRKTIVPCRCAKEEHILLSGANEAANGFREKFAEPWSAGENIMVSGEFGTIGKRYAIVNAVFKIMRQDRDLFVLAACFHELRSEEHTSE